MAAGITVAVGSIAAVIAQFFDWNEIMKDSLKTIEGFEKGITTIRDAREAISSLGDAEINRNFELAKRAVKLDQADSSARQRALEEEIEVGKTALDAFKDELRERESALKAAIKTEQDLRKRLADRTNQGVTDFAGFDPDLRAAKLNQEARLAADRGDLDRAEALEKEAQAVAENAKNRAFAAADAKNTADAINRGLEEGISKAKTQVEQLREQKDAQQAIVDGLEEAIDKTTKRLAAERRITKELAEQAKILKNSAKEALDQQRADTGARGAEAQSRKIVTNLAFGNQSTFEAIKALPGDLAKVLTDEGDRQAVIKLAEEAAKPAATLEALAKQVIAGEATGRDILSNQEAFGQLTDIVGNLQAQLGRGELGGSGKQLLDRLEKLQSAIEGLFDEATTFTQGRGLDTRIRTGSQGATREDMSKIRDALLNKVPVRIGEEVSKAIQGQPSRAAQAETSPQPVSTGSPAPTQTAAANINVTANVKGGIIDAEVTREITRIIKQELRKQTSNAPVA